MENERDQSLPELFGSMVFNEETMKERLSGATFKAWKTCVENGEQLDLQVANEIAEALKQWSLEMGATHFTHWFQPMTGVTAEKHDSFIEPKGDGTVVMEFSGKELVKGEPDASSFPSGGLRATFEARGYTAWDPTSYAFVKDRSLYIPTVFCSYGGQALDKKTPLLRSMEALSREAVRILRLFGDKTTKKVIAQCGPEQEYFLLDKDLYNQREDLRLTGRTLFGNQPPKGQELEDHYFGQLKPRVSAFMQELDTELWKVGVLSKTKHNEVAPSQHELAPIYSDANQAADQNQITMEMMKRVAGRHHFACLIHEKPYAGVNGSGKHDNWSLATDAGKNLLRPGSTPSQTAQFLLFLAAFIKGIDEYQEAIRATVAFAGNDHRLGAQEAPPAIISIFLGDELEGVVESIIQGKNFHDQGKRQLLIGIDTLPPIPMDNTDRNRTSPMAFTGNKFEFRMLGSSQSISGPNIALNTIMAQELRGFAEVLEKSKDFQKDLQVLIKKTLTEHQRIVFNGNGYDVSWVEEAKRRGLSNLTSTAEALPKYVDPKNVELFVKNGIYTEEELYARYNIHVNTYNAQIAIEARTMDDMIRRQILPAVSAYTAELCRRMGDLKNAQMPMAYETEICTKSAKLTDELLSSTQKLEADMEKVPENNEDAMRYYHRIIVKDMEACRLAADQLEAITDEKYWPFPVYSKLLFSEK